MKITGATLTRLSIATAFAFVVLVTSACDHKMSRFAAGHPPESTTVVDWQSKGERAIAITFRFRDDAPNYGCSVEAFNLEGESIGLVQAKPGVRMSA